MRRSESEAIARPMIAAAAGVLGVGSEAAWDLVAGPAARAARGQPSSEVSLIRIVATVALVEAGLPFMTAAGACGSRRRKQDGDTAATMRALVLRLEQTAPAMLAAARTAAGRVVAARPTLEHTRAEARRLMAEAMATLAVGEAHRARALASTRNLHGVRARRRVASRLIAEGHVTANVATAMGWDRETIRKYVRHSRSQSGAAC